MLVEWSGWSARVMDSASSVPAELVRRIALGCVRNRFPAAALMVRL